jgi:Mce-associated membrane protein
MPSGKAPLSVLVDDEEETETDEATSAAVAEDVEPTDFDIVPAEGSAATARRFSVPSRKTVAVGIAIVITCAFVAASGYMAWHHSQAVHDHQLAAEYAAGARQAVVTLMSLDFTKANDDVQRIIDNSTGQFKADFEGAAGDFVKAAQDSKVVAEATVQSAAVESMTGDSAVVLVAATSKVTNTAGAKQEPRAWRLSVNVVRDSGQIKLSKVEFIP